VIDLEGRGEPWRALMPVPPLIAIVLGVSAHELGAPAPEALSAFMDWYAANSG
jgi:hypothetical protein